MYRRSLLRTFVKSTSVIMYSMSFMHASVQPQPKKPNAKEKLVFEPLDLSKFTHEFMIQQSTVDAVNSASQALTVTYTAIISTSNEYKTLLSQLISLSKDTMQFQVTDQHWATIVELRSQVQSKKDILNKLSGYVDYVHKMATAATEISFLSGMDHLSITLSQRIDDALKNIKEEFDSVTLLEQEYCEVQEACIRNTKTNKTKGS